MAKMTPEDVALSYNESKKYGFNPAVSPLTPKEAYDAGMTTYRNYGGMMRDQVGPSPETKQAISDAFRIRPMSPGHTTPDQYGPVVRALADRQWAGTGGQPVDFSWARDAANRVADMFRGAPDAPAAPAKQTDWRDTPAGKQLMDRAEAKKAPPAAPAKQPPAAPAAQPKQAIPTTGWEADRIKFMQQEGMFDKNGNPVAGAREVLDAPGVYRLGNKYAGYGKPETPKSFQQQMQERALGAMDAETAARYGAMAINDRQNDINEQRYKDVAAIDRDKNKYDAEKGMREERRLDLIEKRYGDMDRQARAKLLWDEGKYYEDVLNSMESSPAMKAEAEQAKKRNRIMRILDGNGIDLTEENINAAMKRYDQNMAAQSGKAAGGVVGYADGGEVEYEMEDEMESPEMAIDPTAMGAKAGMETGDYVFPVEAVRFYGTKLLKDMVQKAMMAEE